MEIRTLSADLDAIARQELKEDPNRIQDDLKLIRDWLTTQPHLTARTDSQWLVTMLRGCKFSVERAKTKMDMFYTLRTVLPEFFTRRDPMLPELQRILKLGLQLPLPQPDDHGRRVILMRIGVHNPDEVKTVDIFKVNMMIMDILLEEDDRSVVCGIVLIIDHLNTTIKHMVQYSPSFAKKTITLLQEGYLYRPQGIHHFHMNSTVAAVFNMFKSFMKEKMRKRLHVHANVDSLYEYVPKRILPQEYGGEAGPIDKITEEWKRKVEARRDWLVESEKYISDEKKRPGGRPKTEEDLFGLEGSFRQLNVD